MRGIFSRKHYARRCQGIFPELFFSHATRLRLQVMAVGFVRHCKKEVPMSWTTPRVVEIAVGMEINCYACAEI